MSSPAEHPVQNVPPRLPDAIKTWTKIGVLSFGGPTAQIALMHNVVVDEKKWLSEKQFLSALSFCMLLPGPEAMQLATYVGWRLNGIWGGLAAGLLFIIPGAFVVLALAMIYASFGNLPTVEAIFLGVKAAVLVIVIDALLRIAKRALELPEHWLIAALSFVGIFLFALPFPLIIFASALWGYLHLSRKQGTPPNAGNIRPSASARQTLQTTIQWLAIWIVPLIAVFIVFGPNHTLSNIGIFFSKLAMVTFGGAYAVLAYMTQDVVIRYGWLEAGQMLDGLGLAETTPGPLILVTEFVGYLAGYQSVEEGSWLLGIAGALIALWATFAPCFLWIFVGAPYIEWITAQPKLKGALTAITAAVVGVMLNLAIWFALHVFFKNVNKVTFGPINLWLPDITSVEWRIAVLAIVSGILLLRLKWQLTWVLAISALMSIVLTFTHFAL